MNLTSANLQVATQAATQTVQAEATALQTLATALATDPNLPKALELILQTQGRVVVTGVGKSGHIGGKIAASLASTGTPSLFVHPTEALHGDLGMILAGDAVLALSNSGETPELADLIAHELRLIEQLQFADYFLTVWDIVRWARERDILCQGRGSAANSAVCFVLGITAV
ncbi:MAG: SIS domain-containing protein, partial [Proteobacteria bacterium]|nr:SIS domain-containing protein [Pseudomonadota bacterium]